MYNIKNMIYGVFSQRRDEFSKRNDDPRVSSRNVYVYDEIKERKMSIQEAVNTVIDSEEYTTLRFLKGTYFSENTIEVKGPIIIEGLPDAGSVFSELCFNFVCYGDGPVRFEDCNIRGFVYISGPDKSITIRNCKLNESSTGISPIIIEAIRIVDDGEKFIKLKGLWVSLKSLQHADLSEKICHRFCTGSYSVKLYNTGIYGNLLLDDVR